MATDVKLDQVDGSFLHLEGRVVKAVGSDFMLDSPQRRIAAKGYRRALVHDQRDGLTKPPFVLSVTGMDHDRGDPDEAAAKVTKALNDFAAKLTLTLPLLGVDPTIGAYIQSFVNLFGGTVGDLLAALFGMGDDRVGDNAMRFFDYDAALPAWRTPAPKVHPDFDRPHNVQLVLDNGKDGNYIAFFNVRLFKESRILVPAEVAPGP